MAIVIVARAVLACVFAVAAAGKLLDIPGSQAAMEQFGLPGGLARVAGGGLPVLEACLAVALLIDTTSRPAAIGAVVLLAVFVAGIVRLLARGEKAECHCFGALHSAEVGASTLARNAGLAVLAAVVAVNHRQGALSVWVGNLHGTAALAAAEGAVLLAVLVAAGSFVFSMLRRHGALLLKLDELEARVGASASAPVAKPAPAFSLSGLHGETVTLQSLLAPGNPVLLLFTDPECGPCTALMPEIAGWQAAHTEVLSIALISSGSIDSNRQKASEHGVAGVYVQEGSAVNDAYGIAGTPSAVLVSSEATITEPVATGADNIRQLLQRALQPSLPQVVHVPAVAPAAAPPAVPVPAAPVPLLAGAPVPYRRLTDLRGRPVNLASGKEQSLLVFWNPQCGFCERLQDDLVAWEQARGPTEPQLVLIADGPEEANRALPFAAPVVLDPGSTISREFGAHGTPSALLVDDRGRVASELAVGGPALLSLASASRELVA